MHARMRCLAAARQKREHLHARGDASLNAQLRIFDDGALGGGDAEGAAGV